MNSTTPGRGSGARVGGHGGGGTREGEGQQGRKEDGGTVGGGEGGGFGWPGEAARIPHRASWLRRASSRSQDPLTLRAFVLPAGVKIDARGASPLGCIATYHVSLAPRQRMQGLASEGIACTGGPNDGLPTQANQIKRLEPEK